MLHQDTWGIYIDHVTSCDLHTYLVSGTIHVSFILTLILALNMFGELTMTMTLTKTGALTLTLKKVKSYLFVFLFIIYVKFSIFA